MDKIGTIDKYKQYASNDETNNNSSTTNDYYEMAKNQEYASLLDKEIELENAKSNALKLTNNQIASQGIATQGYGSSQMSGITGRYLNAYESANREYQSNISSLNQQQHQEQITNDADKFESITTMMSQANDIDQMNSLLTDYGYGSYVKDDKGNDVFEFGEKPEGMSDDDWYQMKYYYNLQKSAIEQNNTVEEYAATYRDLGSWRTATYLTNDGKTKTIEKEFKYESNALWTKITAGQYTYGTTIKMQNGSGDVVYVQWTQNGLKMTDKKTYDESEKKDSLVWQQNVNK